MENSIISTEKHKDFHIRILGRMLEHLGVQMYKRRDAAIAELVANAWDAGAKNVWIVIPQPDNYDPSTSTIIIEDDGSGMSSTDLQDKYLIIGRNRREDEKSNEAFGRRVMGRKGIGKLSGFGIASKMILYTWQPSESIEVTLDLSLLNHNPEKSEDPDKVLKGTLRSNVPFTPYNNQNSGTRILLKGLKQASPIGIDELHEALSRRISRTVKGIMSIHINGEELRQFNLPLHTLSRTFQDSETEDTLPDGKKLKYNYVFTEKPIGDNELRGWTILVNGKTAQKPNFFFNVDAKGASQHSSKYLCGYIEADYLDEGIEDETDFISTDRQEIDWDREETKSLWEWGKSITQKIFIEISERNSEENVNVILSDDDLKGRINNLDKTSQSKINQFLTSIGTIKVVNEDVKDTTKIKQLGDQIIKAFEYRHFIDVIDDIEEAGTSSSEEVQSLLGHLAKWEVLESRSILEIIKGRIKVIDKFFNMIVERAPETANRQIGTDNFHDLIAGFPWLLNPEWQVFIEEKSISSILKAKGEKDIPELMRSKRVDFLAMQGDDTIAIIEIKKPDDVLPLEEIRRLEDYSIALQPAHTKKIVCVLIYSGNHSIPETTWSFYKKREDFLILEWKDIFTKNRGYYEHYRAVLENHITDPKFHLKETEIKYTKKMLEKGTVYRDITDRAAGLGPQDITTT